MYCVMKNMKFDHIKKNLSIFKGMFSPAIDDNVNSELFMVTVPELNENYRFIFWSRRDIECR
jgi:hypothetical protein